MTRAIEVPASDGTRIAVHGLGGQGRPVVAVHAAGFLAETLRPLANALGDSYRWWAPDLRGHGVSAAPPDLDFSWSGFALDVLAAARIAVSHLTADEHRVSVTSLGPKVPGGDPGQLVGIGHSVGATALLVAEASCPGTFAALYCYEPILVPPADRRPLGSPNPLSAGARRRQATFASRSAAAERYRNRGPLSRLDPAVLAAYVEHGFADLADGSVTLRCRPEHEALVYDYGLTSDAFDQLARVRCPVTVAVGADSTDRGRTTAPVVVAALAHGHLVELDGVGHLGPLESPTTVAASILDSVEASTS